MNIEIFDGSVRVITPSEDGRPPRSHFEQRAAITFQQFCITAYSFCGAHLGDLLTKVANGRPLSDWEETVKRLYFMAGAESYCEPESAEELIELFEEYQPCSEDHIQWLWVIWDQYQSCCSELETVIPDRFADE